MVEQELVHAIEAVLNSKKNMKNPKKVIFYFFLLLLTKCKKMLLSQTMVALYHKRNEIVFFWVKYLRNCAGLMGVLKVALS